MPQVIPFTHSIEHYQFTTVIEGDPYRFEVRWNERDQAWYFDLSEIDGTSILRGVKIVLGCFLGRTSSHPLLAAGGFVAQDATRSGLDAGFGDLGRRIVVAYLTGLEIMAAYAVNEAT